MATTPERTPQANPQGPVRVVGFLCDWAVRSEGLLNADDTIVGMPHVTVIRVPCSGFVKPAWLELALRSGAAGTFVCGCPMGDCLNREGNWIMEDRIDQLRKRLSRQKVDPDRVAFFAFGLHERESFLQAVAEFVGRLAGSGGNR